MNWPVPPWVDVVQRHFHHSPDPVLVHLVHRVRHNAVLSQDAFLARVDVAQTDVHDALGGEHRLDPTELGNGLAKSEEEGDGHAVNVSFKKKEENKKKGWILEGLVLGFLKMFGFMGFLT